MTVRVLFNDRPDAGRTGYRLGDALRTIYHGPALVPSASDVAALRALAAVLTEAADEPPAAWRERCNACLTDCAPPRSLRNGDICVIAGRAYAYRFGGWAPTAV
jgi:hypothetical protein